MSKAKLALAKSLYYLGYALFGVGTAAGITLIFWVFFNYGYQYALPRLLLFAAGFMLVWSISWAFEVVGKSERQK